MPTRRPAYPSDLTDAQWALVRAAMPLAVRGRTGRPRTYALREVWNAVFSLSRNGCTWRTLPHDFPPWAVVWDHFRRWRDNGTLERVHAARREAVRVRARSACGPVGSQRRVSPSSTASGADDGNRGPKGFDAGKKVKGRKRQLVVDTLGLVLAVVVHSAGIQDRDGARLVLEKLRQGFPRLAAVLADAGYNGPIAVWVRATLGVVFTLGHKVPGQRGFQALPKRWVVERTFGWLGRHRRLSKDYERNPASSEAWIYSAMIHLMTRRLAA